MLQERWVQKEKGHRIHIFGPSGAGTSTLGRALSTALASQHFDADDFYWRPSDPPFKDKRPVQERIALMENVFLPRRDWILSGSIDRWAGDAVSRFTLAIRLTLDRHVRRSRLEYREAHRCGCTRGWGEPICVTCAGFLSWADGYESGDRPGRSLSRDLAFARSLKCPVLVLDTSEDVATLVRRVLLQLDPAVAVN